MLLGVHFKPSPTCAAECVRGADLGQLRQQACVLFVGLNTAGQIMLPQYSTFNERGRTAESVSSATDPLHYAQSSQKHSGVR